LWRDTTHKHILKVTYNIRLTCF